MVVLVLEAQQIQYGKNNMIEIKQNEPIPPNLLQHAQRVQHKPLMAYALRFSEEFTLETHNGIIEGKPGDYVIIYEQAVGNGKSRSVIQSRTYCPSSIFGDTYTLTGTKYPNWLDKIIKTLKVEDGDLILYRVSDIINPRELGDKTHMLSHALREVYPSYRNLVIGVRDLNEIEKADEEVMRSHGWVKIEENDTDAV